MNILSIDFDIIMAPDIQLYNAYVGRTNINQLSNTHPILSMARADLGIYQRLVDFLMKAVDNVDISNIRVAASHQDIMNIMMGECDITMYSIDHHHDCGYGGKMDICDCANWVAYHANQDIITQYVWIRNPNSEEIVQRCNFNITQVNFFNCDFNGLPKFDKIFICLSPEWVPEHYHPLFFLMLDLINQKKNCQLQYHM